ncbi:hypothetical protein D3C73_969460 [compost metagenome]
MPQFFQLRVVIFLIGVVGQPGSVPEFSQLITIALLILAICRMINRLISPIKRDHRATSWHFDILLLAVAHIHFELVPFMRIHIRATHTFIQASNNTLLLILICLPHIVHAVNKNHNTGHRAFNSNIAGFHTCPRRFRNPLYTCCHDALIKRAVTHRV